MAFLAHASKVLAGTLDYPSTLAEIARLCVPALADWCGIDARGARGEMVRVASAHADPLREALANELARHLPHDPGAEYGAPLAIRTGEPVLYSEITPEKVRAVVKDSARAQGIIDLGIRSAMVAPLVARGRTLGAITFISDVSERRYSREDLAFAEDLAARAALALDNAWLYQEAQDALARHRSLDARFRHLVDASGALVSALEPAAVLPAVLELSRTIIEADAYAVWREDREANVWRLVSSAGLSEAFLALSREIPADISLPDEPIVEEDVSRIPLLHRRQEAYRAESIRSILVVPLRVHGQRTGTIAFYYRARHRIPEEDIHLATALANLAGGALGAAELYQAERKTSNELALLHRAGSLLSSTLDTRLIYATLRELASTIMPCDGMLISSYSRSDGMIRCAYAWVEGNTLDPDSLPPVKLAPPGQGIQSQVIHTGEAAIVNDMRERLPQTHSHFIQPDGSVLEAPLPPRPVAESAMYVPIKLEGEVLGVVQVQSYQKNAYTRDHLRVLEALILQVAAAGRNAFLYQQARAELLHRKQAEEQVKELNERLKRAMTETHHRVKNNLQIIAAMIDMQVMDNPAAVPVDSVQKLGSHVMTLASVHDILTHEARPNAGQRFVSARAILDRLIPLIQNTTGGRTIRYRAEEVLLAPKQGTTLALIVNELVNNAVKHGAASVEVSLAASGDSGASPDRYSAVLKVADDGPGFPPGFDPHRSAGKGLELVVSLSRWDLQGSIRCLNDGPGSGACVIVTFPLERPPGEPDADGPDSP